MTTLLQAPMTNLEEAEAIACLHLLRVLSVTATAYLFPGAGHSRIFLPPSPAQLYLTNYVLFILNLNLISAATSVFHVSTPILPPNS